MCTVSNIARGCLVSSAPTYTESADDIAISLRLQLVSFSDPPHALRTYEHDTGAGLIRAGMRDYASS